MRLIYLSINCFNVRIFNYDVINLLVQQSMNRLLLLQPSLIAQNHSLDSKDLSEVIFGPNYHMRNYSYEVIRSENLDRYHYHINEDSKDVVRKQTLLNLFKLRNRFDQTYQYIESNPNQLTLYSNGHVFYDMGTCVRAGVHAFLYLKSIQHLGTQNHKELLERGFSYKDVGCFGLTELTHGSNVRGILTEAHYDHQNQEFIINTPSKEGMKFWIGGAAQTTNNAVIWAQLYIGQKCYGVHAYVVPIRDPATHKLLPGVLIGDCGPKNGLNGIDNGFIILDKVRIPKYYQLNRISGVDDKGNFQSIVENDQKRFGLHLAALSGGRFFITTNCCALSLSSLTIAIRYCNERRQFKGKNDKQQKLLIDYPLTKRRMMPLLAQNMVYYTGGMKFINDWDANQKNILDPKHPMIEQLHAISSVMKSKASWFASQCIHECRQMLGGHGYSSYSKLGVLFNDNDVNLTWEGDNHVLIQQASKYVLEQAQQALQKGKQSNNPLLKFFNNPPSELIKIDRQNLTDLGKGLQFLQYKLMRKVEETGMKMLQLKQEKLPTMEIWNNSQAYLGREVAETFGDIALLTTMCSSIQKSSNENNKAVLLNATKLWMLSLYRKDQFIDLTNHPLIETLIGQECEKLAKRSLEILKIISVQDDVIGSPFADPNGRGIEKYLSLLMSKPTNQRQSWWEMIVTR